MSISRSRSEITLALLRSVKTKQHDKWTIGGRARTGKAAKVRPITLAKVEAMNGRR